MSQPVVHTTVRWSSALRAPAAPEHTPQAALFGREPLVVLGAERNPPLCGESVRASARSCFGPRGAAMLTGHGPLWICDTGHHRLLGWARCPEQDGAPADWVIGQADFACEGRNDRGAVSATSLNVPTGISALPGGGIAVADAWNHRVLIWRSAPRAHNVPADLVLGQADFASAEANRGQQGPRADTLFWPYGVAWCDGHLFVADSENRRVLVWRGLPERNGQAAALVLGQTAFEERDENAGREPDGASMRWPHAVCSWRGNLCVTDAGNNRVLVYRGVPRANGQAADFILGQTSPSLVDHNQSLYWPRAGTLNMPYGVTAAGDWLVVADTANSRLLGLHADDLATGANARALLGQPTFDQKGDNRWQPAAADSLCWPYGVGSCQVISDAGERSLLVVADSGNNRVSVWELTA